MQDILQTRQRCFIESGMDRVGAARTAFQTLQPSLIEGSDDIAHCLIVTPYRLGYGGCVLPSAGR
jgi:hypothetical protein